MTAPAVLLPYQQSWVADRSAVKVCEKSRRVGISWADASDSALTSSARREAGGMNCWYVGYNKDMALEYINDVAMWARHFQLAAAEIGEEVIKDDDRDILAYVVKFASGYRVTALSSRPSNLRGKQGRVVIDEAAYHPDLDGLLKSALALLIWGGRVAVISTHNGETNAFNELILEARAGKTDYSVHRITFGEALMQGLYQRICLSTGRTWTQVDEDAWRASIYLRYRGSSDEELDVIPSSGSGAFLTRAEIEGCMSEHIPVIRLSQPDSFALLPKHIREADALDWCREYLEPLLKLLAPNLDNFFGSDFGRISDLSVIWPLQQRQDLTLTTPFLVELRNIPFEQQRQILFYIVDRLPRFMGGAMDARGNGQYLAEVAVQQYGVTRIEAVMLSQAWYLEHMPRLKAAYEDRTCDIPKDADVMSDLRSVRKDKGIAKVPDSTGQRGADGQPRHGDSAIAQALALYAQAVMDAAPIEYEPIPSKNSRWEGNPNDDRDDTRPERAGAL